MIEARPLPDHVDACVAITQAAMASGPDVGGQLHCAREAENDALAILALLRNGLASGDVDPGEALWIIDMAPGDGERAWRVLRHLEANAPRAPTVRYLARCDSAEQASALSDHYALQPLRRRGELLVARDAVPPHPVRNPMVVLWHGGMCAGVQGLYAVHYGELLESAGAHAEHVTWQPMARENGMAHLLAAYRQSLNSAAFTLPLGVMEMLDVLLRASAGRLLLLASDEGASGMAQIRLGAAAPRPDGTLPVNFEALGRWQRARGADVRQSQLDDAGRVYHVALHDRGEGRLRHCLAELAALPHPDEHVALLTCLDAGHPLSVDQCIAILRAHGADPRALLAIGRQSADVSANVQGTALLRWREMLSRVWEQHYRCDGDNAFRALLAGLAMNAEHWALAREVLRTLLRGEDAETAWRMLADCQVRTGGTRAALCSLAQAGASADAHALCERATAWAHRPLFRADLARDGELVLEPLDGWHVDDMLFQYRDPQIGMMTRLPEFEDAATLHDWLAPRMAETERLDCAVMHAQRGFVGVVSAHWSRDDAFLHFWIGADHQGCGFSVRAATLMNAMLEAGGIARCFTAVYPDNHRSLRTLRRAGFVAVPARAAAPDEAMIFMARELASADPDLSRLARSLREFARRTDSAFVFPPEEKTRKQHAQQDQEDTHHLHGARLLS